MRYSFYKNQQFDRIKSQCIASKTLFEDPEFPAADKSLFFSKQPTFSAVWKRPGVRFFLGNYCNTTATLCMLLMFINTKSLF